MIKHSPFYYVSKYRTALMGFAILWVVWFHSRANLNFFPIGIINTTFDFLKTIGYGGVDIFLFVSGMGIYQSLSKNSSSEYIINRIKRIVPTWYSYLIICVVCGMFFFDISFTLIEIIGFLTFSGYWAGLSNQGNWYVYATFLLYFLSPIFYSLLNRKKSFIFSLALILVSILVSIVFVHHDWLIIFSRFPIYIIGMSFAALIKQIIMTKCKWIICSIVMVFGILSLAFCIHFLSDYLWEYGLWWYPFIAIAPSFSLLFCGMLDFFNTHIHGGVRNIAKFIINYIGKSSLEILLISDILFANIYDFNLLVVTPKLTAFLIYFFAIIIGLVFHFVIERGRHLAVRIFRLERKL